jgi:hypothetical protein
VEAYFSAKPPHALPGEFDMKLETKKRGLVGLWLFASLLMFTAALRDIFAPGFLSMSGQVMSRAYITGEFVVAAAMMAYALWLSSGHYPKSAIHK